MSDSPPAGPATLRAMREARHISQSKLAARSGFDHSYLSRIESGTRTPTLDALRSIAVALELGPDDAGRLQAAFGYLPSDVRVLLDDEPEVARLYLLMRGESVSGTVKALVRTQLATIASQMEVTTR